MASGRRVAVWVFAVALVLLVAAVAAGIWMVWKRPLTVDAWSTRRALAKAGLEKTFVEGPEGRVTVWEGGEGPPLMLLHGAGDQAGTWSEVVPSLVGSYSLYILDLPGHRDSPPQEGPLGVGMVLGGVEAVLAARSPHEPFTLVGNSLGAWVSMLAAKEMPDRVARLVLVNGGAILGHVEGVNLMPSSREEARRLMGFLRAPSSPAVPDFVLDDIVRTVGSGPVARLVVTSEDMVQYLLDDRLDEVRTPVDLIWGEYDGLFPMEYPRRLMDGLPAARLQTIPDCGHVPHRECPAAFAAELGKVLRQPPPAPRPALESGEEPS